jgi:hypothetical protein
MIVQQDRKQTGYLGSVKIARPTACISFWELEMRRLMLKGDGPHHFKLVSKKRVHVGRLVQNAGRNIQVNFTRISVVV